MRHLSLFSPNGQIKLSKNMVATADLLKMGHPALSDLEMTEDKTQKTEAMMRWIIQNTKDIIPAQALAYGHILYDNNIPSMKKLAKKLERNEGLLLSLGFDDDDSDEVSTALKNTGIFKGNDFEGALSTSATTGKEGGEN